LYEHFKDICEIMKAYDICFSLVTACAPARLPTRNDEAQFAERNT
jgi:phosphomethylpyrimidine synthase